MAEPWAKAETVDPEVRAYVYSLVNAVGGSSYDDTYAVGDDALAALNDILRWLLLYDEKLVRYDVKRCLAEANLVQGDLLEILALWSEETAGNRLKAKLSLACLQLLVPLTWPLEAEDDKTTINHHRHLPYLQLAQVGYKRAILHYERAKILRAAVRIGLPAMAVERRERSNRDESIIGLVLYLCRNMAIIAQPQLLPSQGDENEVGRAATIEAFADQDVFRLLLTIGSGANDEFQQQDVILLETLFHLLKGVDSNRLFVQEKQLQSVEADELQMLMQKEKAMLNGYNKQAPSRHNRFGTMIWVKRDDTKVSTVSGQHSIASENMTLQQMDASKKWNKPKPRGKMAHEHSMLSDFGGRVDLTERARMQLRSFVEDFLDSSFNPLFSSLRKAIERETDRVGEAHKRQYFYLIHWFLGAERARRDEARKESERQGERPGQTNVEDNTFAYIAAVLDQETFVLLNRNMQRAFDEKSWLDLQATLLCFTQILQTVQSMAESNDEEDQEIAENIQNRIFYEEATHDRIVQILRGYTNQGFAYLDAITDCVHVFVRMLEKYSKQNVDLQIRSKRRVRRKARTQGHESLNPEDAAEQNAEDEREAHLTVSERKFDFARFSTKFLSQGCVDTFVALTHFYADLTPAQLKRCHRYFYRLAFKHELALYLFRVDIILLLHRMIKGPNGLPTEIEGFKDWEQLIQQLFRKCVKWMSKETEGEGWKEMCVVEMLFSKIPGMTFYLQNGYEKVVETRPPRAPAELEFRASVEVTQHIPVAVSILLEQAKGDAIEWVKKELGRAAEGRQAWQDKRDAWVAGHDGNTDASAEGEGAQVVFFAPENDEIKMALFKDKYLRLLLTTLGLQRLGLTDDVDASWVVPSEISAQTLGEKLRMIQQAEFDPPSLEEGQTAIDMVRNKSSKYRNSAPFEGGSDEEGGLSDVDEAMFPPNLREKRKEGDERPMKRRRLTRRNRKELTEDELKERADERKRREKERNRKIKSQLYVTTEDDASDSEGDAEFFRLEEERRKKMSGIIRSTLLKETENGAKKKGQKRKASSNGHKTAVQKKHKTMVSSESEGEGDSGNELIGRQEAADSDDTLDSRDTEMEDTLDLLGHNGPDSQDDSGEESDREEGGETPSTSPTAAEWHTPLKDVYSNASKPEAPLYQTDEAGDEEGDEAPVTKPLARRNVRGGFIIDSDSE